MVARADTHRMSVSQCGWMLRVHAVVRVARVREELAMPSDPYGKSMWRYAQHARSDAMEIAAWIESRVCARA